MIPAPIKSTNTTNRTNRVNCVQFKLIAKAKHTEDTGIILKVNNFNSFYYELLKLLFNLYEKVLKY